MLRVSPGVFQVLLNLIEEHSIFQNNSNNPQKPVEVQLATTLYRMGRYGNGASLEDVARICGGSEGDVKNATRWCFDAIESLHDLFIRPLTREEKEIEKEWMDQHLGFQGLWREGWVMYDGTIVVLYAKPGLNGDAYYTHKGNYGLNAQVSSTFHFSILNLTNIHQIGNVPSNLRILDYAHGHTGSAHDAAAFEHTGAANYPEWFFEGEEFAWADSAYSLDPRTIPIHKKPASLRPENIIFDRAVSHLRVRSEHCMGALKGQFQCLQGLRVNINSNSDHVQACHWITIAIILHNMVIDVEGGNSAGQFGSIHRRVEEEEDRGHRDEPNDDPEEAGEEKRKHLKVNYC